MQKVKLQRKNSTVSRGTCCHGLFYSRRERSTKRLYFMQNKANFQKSQMDVSLTITNDYKKKSHWTFGENKANQSQSFDKLRTSFSGKGGWGRKETAIN
jgi:hypothetical protein